MTFLKNWPYRAKIALPKWFHAETLPSLSTGF